MGTVEQSGMGKMNDEELLEIGRFVVGHGEYILLALASWVETFSTIPEDRDDERKSAQTVLGELCQLLRFEPKTFSALLADAARGKN